MEKVRLFLRTKKREGSTVEQENGSTGLAGDLRKVVQIDEARLKSGLSELVLGTVEETLNALLVCTGSRNAEQSQWAGF